jgi:hypothetical protein
MSKADRFVYGKRENMIVEVGAPEYVSGEYLVTYLPASGMQGDTEGFGTYKECRENAEALAQECGGEAFPI